MRCGVPTSAAMPVGAPPLLSLGYLIYYSTIESQLHDGRWHATLARIDCIAALHACLAYDVKWQCTDEQDTCCTSKLGLVQQHTHRLHQEQLSLACCLPDAICTRRFQPRPADAAALVHLPHVARAQVAKNPAQDALVQGCHGAGALVVVHCAFKDEVMLASSV